MFNFCKEIEIIFNIIARYAQKESTPVYFVGGMVRDALMGQDIGDIDILVEGSAIDFVKGLKEACDNGFARINVHGAQNPLIDRFFIDIKSVHESFNTIKAQINGIEIDFASTREEDYPHSGCLPVVKNIGCPIRVDLKRRDFTINAIATRILMVDNTVKYELIDIYNGIEDIKQGKLRVLHDKSYNDDPTRVLRGLDFNLRFNFTFSNSDKNLIENFLKSPDRTGLSLDRVKLTLKKLFSSANRAKAAYENILLKKFYKIWCDEPEFKLEWVQRLVESAKIFNLPSEEIFLKVFFENLPANLNAAENSSNYEIYNLYKNLKTIDLALQYAIFDDKNPIFYYEKLKDIKPDLTGDDLLKQGYKQGKALGEALSRLLEEKLNSIPRS